MDNNLQKLRWEKGWTQSELSRKSGVDRAMISKIENGIRPNPSVNTALLLSKALDVDVKDIFIL